MNPLHFPRWVIKIGILTYQKLLNPILHSIGGSCAGCRYTPSCSNYFLEAVEKHGALKGSWYGMRRICRCHPWGGSGEDPVPEKRSRNKNIY